MPYIFYPVGRTNVRSNAKKKVIALAETVAVHLTWDEIDAIAQILWAAGEEGLAEMLWDAGADLIAD